MISRTEFEPETAPARTLADVLPRAAARWPDKIAIVFRSKRITYAAWNETSNQLANVLLAHTGMKTFRVAIQLPRSAEYLIAYFGAAQAGATIVPLSPDLTLEETRSVLEYCDVDLLVSNQSRLLGGLQGSSTRLGKLKAIFLLGDGDGDAASSVQYSCPVQRLEPLMAAAPRIKPRCIDPGDIALLLHTSGTLSAPKRVMLSHRNVLCNARAHVASLGLAQWDVALLVLPMFFGYCNTAQIIAHALLGGSLVLLPGQFAPAPVCELAASERVTTITMVPTMLLCLAEYHELERHNLSSLRYVCFGGSPMPWERLRLLMTRLPHTRFIQTYGQTEASPRVTMLPAEEGQRKPESVGRPIPGVGVAIVDASGIPLPPNVVGEIAVTGPGIMLGYYKRPEETSAVFRDGMLLTGDMGYLDTEGYLYLVGRKKNVIIRGGINLYPEEIEQYLLKHPGVADVMISKISHPIQGEVPVANLVPNTERSVTVAELIEFCKLGLSSYKMPVEFHFVDQIPKTKTHKSRRPAA